jgi:hypothetical protein
LNASENKVEISGKEIIQTDGAIIAGILILLTISSFSPFELAGLLANRIHDILDVSQHFECVSPTIWQDPTFEKIASSSSAQ